MYLCESYWICDHSISQLWWNGQFLPREGGPFYELSKHFCMVRKFPGIWEISCKLSLQVPENKALCHKASIQRTFTSWFQLNIYLYFEIPLITTLKSLFNDKNVAYHQRQKHNYFRWYRSSLKVFNAAIWNRKSYD